MHNPIEQTKLWKMQSIIQSNNWTTKSKSNYDSLYSRINDIRRSEIKDDLMDAKESLARGDKKL